MLGTVIIGVLLLAAVAGIVVSMIRNKKKGRSSCGCGCSACAAAGKHCGKK